MTEEQEATHENRTVLFDMASCIAMMEEMTGQVERGCDCAELISQMMGQGGSAELMSQMMASCCGVQGEAEEATTKATQEA